MEIWGSGKPLREFLWSEDMADACIYLLENISFKDLSSRENHTPAGVLGDKESIFKEVRNTHINIGTGKEISIEELAGLICKITGFRGNLVFNASKPDGTMRKLTDVSKLHDLGWHHKIEIEEGINKLYKWYTDHQ